MDDQAVLVRGARSGAVPGVLELHPPVFADDRGQFVTTFAVRELEEATGCAFRAEQASVSRSRAGVVRGIHYTRTPPGVQKLVTCVAGEVLDIAVDLRVGSPTFGRWQSVVLEATAATAVYVPIGVGHAFVALRDDSAVSYLMTRGYVPADELEVSVADPELGLPVTVRPELQSERDRRAPTLREAADRGLLPDLAECRRLEARLRPGRLAGRWDR